MLQPDRLFPLEEGARRLARELYESVRALPIVSPHGHTNAAWFAGNEPFSNPTALLLQPDHYLLRMLYSQGIPLERLGIAPREGDATAVEWDPRRIWRTFAENYYLFRATPSRLWLDFVFAELFGLTERLCAANADTFYDVMDRTLQTPEFLPRALFDRFRIAVLATTDSALDSLVEHRAIRESGWSGRILPTFRPDAVIDAAGPEFAAGLRRLAEITGEDTQSWPGYLGALRKRRQFFKENGATATDHGHASARTADLPWHEAEALFARVLAGRSSAEDRELFAAQMLTEMARMSVEDGLVMQLHPGAYRNHNPQLFAKFGRDMGADIPVGTEYVQALQPLLARFGTEPGFTLILFTLDESTYSRELAPLAGHYPALRLGPPWWFQDSPEGMMRFREQATETAGFYNTVGFNDDTRAFLSIPARHDVARRVDAAFLARLVGEGRLDHEEAFAVMQDLTGTLVRAAYKL